MKADVLTDNLKRGLSIAFRAISTRSQLPVLLNFLLEVKDGFVYISATDLEIGITIKTPAKIEEEGAITVPAKTFLDLISSISEEKITLSLSGSQLILVGKHLRTSFPTISAEEFPKILSERGRKIASVKTGEISKILAKVVFAASFDMGRPALSGVLMKKEGEGLVLVATDGYRLSLRKNFMPLFKEGDIERLIVPSRVLRELVGLGEESQECDFYISKETNQVVFSTKDVVLVGRLIEAEYPDYKKILPEDFETKAVFDRSDAQNAVKACSVFAREAANIIKVSVKKDRVVFSSSASSVGENEVEVAAKIEGEENEIAFNSRYLLDFLSAADDQEVDFRMMGPLNPGVFRSLKDKDYLHIIMPIRIQG